MHSSPGKDSPVKFIAPARVGIVAVAVAVAVALAGCSYVNPIVTEKPYAASDGLQVEIGPVRGLNLLVVTNGLDEKASLTGSLVNSSDVDQEIVIALDGVNGIPVAVPANAKIELGVNGDASVLALSPGSPGGIANVAIQSQATGVITTPVPIVDSTFSEHTEELEALAEADIPASS